MENKTCAKEQINVKVDKHVTENYNISVPDTEDRSGFILQVEYLYFKRKPESYRSEELRVKFSEDIAGTHVFRDNLEMTIVDSDVSKKLKELQPEVKQAILKELPSGASSLLKEIIG